MEKLTLLLLLLSTVIVSYSQTEKGTWLLGGSANAIAADDYFRVYINPGSGYFLANKLCIGASVPFIIGTNDLDLSFSPFMRYYFISQSKHGFYGTGSVNTRPTSLDISDLQINIHAGIGHVYFLNESVGFESELKVLTNLDYYALGLFFGFNIYFNE